MSLKVTIIRSDQYKESKWSGGITKELAIYPENTLYAKRDFIWRLSSATVELEHSVFTKLEDYERILMILSGELIVRHNGEPPVHLKQFGQDFFDGAWDTESFGKVLDFNLMIRKGYGKGRVVHQLIEDSVVLFERDNMPGATTRFALAVDGPLIIETETAGRYHLDPFDSLIIEGTPGKDDSILATTAAPNRGANVVIAEIAVFQ